MINFVGKSLHLIFCDSQSRRIEPASASGLLVHQHYQAGLSILHLQELDSSFREVQEPIKRSQSRRAKTSRFLIVDKESGKDLILVLVRFKILRAHMPSKKDTGMTLKQLFL